MKLELDSSEEFKTLMNVYQGQTDPLEIGTVATRVGPNVIGFYPGDDSVQMNAFFDPSRSDAIDRVLRKRWDNITNYPSIGYIHLGQFRINNYPLKVTIHDETVSYPLTYVSMLGRTLIGWWIDVAEKNDNNIVISSPFYPYWALADDADYDPNQFFQYPQDYGGMTKFPLNGLANDDFRCASMTTDVQIGTGSIPSILEKEVVDNTVLSEFNYNPTELLYEAYKNDPEQLFFALVEQKIISPKSPAQRVVPFLSFDKSRRYYNYTAKIDAKGGRSFLIPLIIMVFRNPTDPTKLAVADITDFVNTVREDLATDSIDLAKLDERISKTQKVDLNLRNKASIEFSYHFTAFPCAIITNTNQKVYTHIFEGFNWGVKRKYKKDTGWENAEVIMPTGISPTGEPNYFMSTLSRYHKKLKNNPNVHTPIHNPLLFG